MNYQYQKKLLKAFDNHELRYRSIHDWFRELLDDVMAGFGLRLDKPWSEKLNDQIFKLATQYGKSLGEAPPFTDILGILYQEIARNYGSKALGQYFTPMHICEMMAQITIDTAVYERNEIVRAYEPTCGSGAMILATMKYLHNLNPKYLKNTSFTLIDLDPICCRMATVQIMSNCLIHNLEIAELFVLQGNSLDDPANLTPYYHVTRPGVTPMSKQAMSAAILASREQSDQREKKLNSLHPVFNLICCNSNLL